MDHGPPPWLAGTRRRTVETKRAVLDREFRAYGRGDDVRVRRRVRDDAGDHRPWARRRGMEDACDDMTRTLADGREMDRAGLLRPRTTEPDDLLEPAHELRPCNGVIKDLPAVEACPLLRRRDEPLNRAEAPLGRAREARRHLLRFHRAFPPPNRPHPPPRVISATRMVTFHGDTRSPCTPRDERGAVPLTDTRDPDFGGKTFWRDNQGGDAGGRTGACSTG